MPNSVLLKARGLYTFPNFLSQVPEGALLDATNVVIDRDGIIEPRRGIKEYGDFGIGTNRAKQLLEYKNRVLVHYSTTLAYDDGSGTITDFAGTFTEVEAGYRLKGIELNGNFFVTTQSGIRKISASSSNLSLATISNAGVPKALDGTGIVDYSTAGFLTGMSKVAYRVVWGIKDVNDNLILSAPSSRIIVSNYDTNSGVVILNFSIPAEITTNHFYQIYRTAVFTAGTPALLDETDPGDEMRLVFEAPVTSGDLVAGEITVTDITPDDFQASGLPLYTNPNTGEGILQSNDRPPVALDIAIFKNCAFFANTRTAHGADFGLVSVSGFDQGRNITNVTAVNPAVITTSGSHGFTTGDRVAINGTGAAVVDAIHVVTVISPTTFSIPVNGTGAAAATGTVWSSGIRITDGIVTNYYFWVGRPEVTPITFDTQTNTTDGSWFEISSYDDAVRYAVWFDKTGTTIAPNTPGKVQIRVNISAVGAGTNVSPTVLTAVEAATVDFDVVQTSGTVLTFTNTNNGPATNAAAGTTPPGGTFAVGTVRQGFGEDTTKHYAKLSGFLSVAQSVDESARSLTRVVSENPSDIVYGYYVSDSSTIPGLMHFDRRDLTDLPFTITSFKSPVDAFSPDISTGLQSSDETAPHRIYFSKPQQPESVPLVNFIDIGPKDKQIRRIVPLRDSLFIFKEDGIYRLTGDSPSNFSVILHDNSVELLAPDSASVLNNQVYCLTDGGIATVTETGVGIVSRPIENVLLRITTDNFPNFSTASFGIGYETERSYYIWTVTDMTDTVATQVFRYNTFTQSWTRWDKSQTCVVLNSDDNKMYVGAADENFIEVERKSLTRIDYADREFVLAITNGAVVDNESMAVSSVADLDIGDALVQTQYVTMSQFNALLKKLDADPRVGLAPGTFDTDYYATLQMVQGDNLTSKMTDLVAKLNADPGTDGGYTFTGTTNFATIQTEYNDMIDDMNADSLLKFDNYRESNGTIDIELTINDINYNINVITADVIPDIMVGPITAFKGIQTTIVWVPNSLSDPSLLKHVSESTVLFEESSFRGGIIAYNNDLSPGFEEIPFTMDGSGTWGGFSWGENNWGGNGSSVPVRTIIPRQKQRCRYIRAKFEHGDAFYKFSILGLSYWYEVSSQRAYRDKR